MAGSGQVFGGDLILVLVFGVVLGDFCLRG
jgi:hypothetical protein